MACARFPLVAALALLLVVPLGAARAGDDLPPTSQFFDEFDRNADGKVTQDEFRGAGEVFRLLDKNADGTITPEELGLPADYKPAARPKHAGPGGEAAGEGRPAPGGQDARAAQRERYRKRLMEMDADKDGRVSKEEWKGPAEAFGRFDRNGDGFLDAQDAPARPGKDGKGGPGKGGPGKGGPGAGGPRPERKGGKGMPPADDEEARARMQERAKAHFATLDKNGDGKVTADEAVNPRLLEMADGNGDGSVTQEEFLAAMLKRGRGGPEGRGGPDGRGERGGRLSAGMLRRWDRDGDGKVSAEEFPGNPELFARMDADKDGFLTEADTKARGAGKGPEGRKAKAADEPQDKPGTGGAGGLIETQDTDGDGRLHRAEFRGSAAEWRLLDKNGDGWITADELVPAR